MDLLRKAIGKLQGRKTAYRQVFGGAPGDEVLSDLARFCRAYETTFTGDAVSSAHLEGRREVYLRIVEHLNLSPDELLKKYGRPSQLRGLSDE